MRIAIYPETHVDGGEKDEGREEKKDKDAVHWEVRRSSEALPPVRLVQVVRHDSRPPIGKKKHHVRVKLGNGA